MDILKQKSGYDYGYGYGYGESGDIIGEIESHDVILLSPWSYVKVGCQIHSVKHWKKNWKKIAKSEGVSVSEEYANQMWSALQMELSGEEVVE